MKIFKYVTGYYYPPIPPPNNNWILFSVAIAGIYFFNKKK